MRGSGLGSEKKTETEKARLTVRQTDECWMAPAVGHGNVEKGRGPAAAAAAAAAAPAAVAASVAAAVSASAAAAAIIQTTRVGVE